MARLFLFADEAGDFAFTNAANASQYFIVGTVVFTGCDIGERLIALRRDMAWRKLPLKEYFHASEDKQVVRDEVFQFLAGENFEIHATIMEKRKAQAHIRAKNSTFYKYGWHYHFKNTHRRYLKATDELHITAASVATKKAQGAFSSAVNDVVQQSIPRNQWVTSFWPASTDPCLQIADYCVWAIQRKWERNDRRSYSLISNKITHEYDMWAHGKTRYY